MKEDKEMIKYKEKATKKKARKQRKVNEKGKGGGKTIERER